MSLSHENSAWRSDYNEYKRLVDEGLAEACADTEKIKILSDKFDNCDIIKSLRANVIMFWGTTAGWENKKAKKIKKINMAMTLINSVEYGHHHVPRNPFTPKYQPPKAEKSQPIAESEQRKNYHYSQIAIKISAAIMRLPDKIERSKKYHDDFVKAIEEKREYAFLDETYEKITKESPSALNLPNEDIFGNSGKKTVIFAPDHEEKRRAFVEQYRR
jgi:hypothetical protein